ncbi:MAG TPA: VOC family protein [Candidatus Acidoferrum sp.]|nr:VOC family protein [Candidatus Acidoferrum sp.]
MDAKINHLAIVSENYALSARFYESLFGMRTAKVSRPRRAVTVGDGYLGLNINPRKAGRPARLDHFGIEVDDMAEAFERLRRDYPQVAWLKRPDSRPFAATTTHDPDGNVFDLSQRRNGSQKDLYAEDNPVTARRVSHFGLRTLNPDLVATFYAETFDLRLTRRANDPNAYVSDGQVTIVIMPWRITDYDGTGIVSPSLDHIGFTVERMETFRADLETIAGDNPRLAPFPFGTGSEGIARLELARRSCPLCGEHLADVDGVILAAAEESR